MQQQKQKFCDLLINLNLYLPDKAQRNDFQIKLSVFLKYKTKF